jgi:hypothetical protein
MLKVRDASLAILENTTVADIAGKPVNFLQHM